MFERDGGQANWKTIGIGDGGNEIGTGGVNQQTRTMQRADGFPVVNNGANIAAKTKTDDMVLSSVSNNGAVGLSIAVDTMLDAVDRAKISTEKNVPVDFEDLKTENNARARVNDYKDVVNSMYKEHISIDGLSKTNQQTIDGRTLERAQGETIVPLGSDGATHDDMFDRLVNIAGNKGVDMPATDTPKSVFSYDATWK
ncbi:MAG: DUF4392 domain-containing protein [Rhodobacteraceae bacterium]|nr:DUF4392 domain-containing protein [Paracoccaceae bacterium]